MQALLKTKIGPFLVISSVLAVWTLLAAQPVQAHSNTEALPAPSCGGLPTAEGFFTDEETAVLPSETSARTEKGTGSTGGNAKFYYARITAPALTAGNLSVTTNASPSDAVLCGRQEGNVTSRTNYAAHNSAESAAAAATRAQTAAQTAADNSSTESSAKRALRTAASALRSAASALTNVATALRNAGNTSAAATDATDASADATADATAAATAADQSPSTETGALRTAATDLGHAATALGKAAGAFHGAFAINTVISSGDEEYVVVVAVPAGADVPILNVTFKGVTATTADAQNGQDGGSFTRNNQRITHTLMTTDNTPGLLTVHTMGSAVRTKGTLETGGTMVATDEGSGGNFKMVSPVKGGVPYALHVDGQTRGERGDYGLRIEFGVASPLTIGTSPTDTMLEPGRADYLFFSIAAGTYNFLTVQTQKHADVTTATDTTGALFSQKGLVVTDTGSGTGNNFLFRVPVAPGDYIVEVKGASASTKGKYVLATSTVDAPSQGTAPDSIMETTGTTIASAAAVNPHSITVAKAGTLQVKTTETAIDTVGVLYGPDGRQLATDDNSGADKNFLITEYVEAGQYIVTVEGQSRSATGAYTLVVNFVEGADIDVTTPTTPGTGGDGTDLQAQVTQLQNDLAACRGTVVTDATGYLENPPDGGVRSGIGVISGWVCATEEVEVEIRRTPNVLVDTLTVAYGTERPDTEGRCRDTNNGFGMTYNFNHLPAGEYTMTAYADDDEQIGAPQIFEVVHLVDFQRDNLEPFETDADDRFLRNLEDLERERRTCIVEDFPTPGQGVWLKWEQSTQNFVIEDAGSLQ